MSLTNFNTELTIYNYNNKFSNMNSIFSLQKTTPGPSILLFGIPNNRSIMILHNTTFDMKLNNNVMSFKSLQDKTIDKWKIKYNSETKLYYSDT